jgi:hypothetical protein
MKGVGHVNAEMAERYFALFVNRLAYTLQSHKPGTTGSTITIAQSRTGGFRPRPFASI